MSPIVCLNYCILVCVRLLFYSQFVSCALLRDLGQKNHPGGKDGTFFEEQISMFQETANGGRRDEGVAAGRGWELLVYLKIATRSGGQIANI